MKGISDVWANWRVPLKPDGSGKTFNLKDFARFHMTLLNEEKKPVCAARAYWVSNLCTTCCCKPPALGRDPNIGGRQAALDSKGMQLVMATEHEGCVNWFGA